MESTTHLIAYPNQEAMDPLILATNVQLRKDHRPLRVHCRVCDLHRIAQQTSAMVYARAARSSCCSSTVSRQQSSNQCNDRASEVPSVNSPKEPAASWVR